MPDPILLLAALLAVAVVLALTVVAAVAIMRRGRKRAAPPRALDPVTVTDGRVERVTGGAR